MHGGVQFEVITQKQVERVKEVKLAKKFRGKITEKICKYL